MQKDYEINEGIFVIYNTVKSLKSEYSYELPKEVMDKTIEYMKYLRNILETDYEPRDIENNKLIDRIIFKDDK